jgi:hypothetical protein
MFSKFLLKKVGIFTLISFLFLITTTNYSFAKEEDVLLKARKYYQQGNYDESVKVLQKFIENLRAIVEQKKNVAEAFYLLAKVYYTVGEDSEVDKNLKKVYETFPSFYKEENDMEFKKKVMKIRKEMGLKNTIPEKTVVTIKTEKKIPTKKVVQKEGKKKKKFPILLVVGGVVVLGVIAYFLLKKKEDVYDIRGQWNIHEDVPADGTIFKEHIIDDVIFNFSGDLEKGTFRDEYGDKGVYTVKEKSVIIKYIDLRANTSFELTGNFTTTENMDGRIIIKVYNYTANGTWKGNKKTTSTLFSKRSSKRHSKLFELLKNI